MSATPARLIALCRPGAPICPRCGRGVSGVPIAVAGGTVTCCRNRKPRDPVAGRTENHCGQHVAIIPAPGGLVLVLALTAAEARTISYGQSLALPTAEIAECHTAT